MFLIFDVLFLIIALLYIPIMIFKGKWHSEFKYRFFGLSNSIKDELSKSNNIWIHAVSVGEVLAISDLIKKLEEVLPGYRVVLTTVTKTGMKVANEIFKGNEKILFAPLDFSWSVRKYVSAIRPKVYVAAETELWPNLFSKLNKENIPILIINGRISNKSFKGYKRIKFLIQSTLEKVSKFSMQSDLDSERIEQLGAKKARITTVGNLKFDNLPEKNDVSLVDFGFSQEDQLFIAGSTHPGEESSILASYNALIKKGFLLKLIIAPRHVERVSEIEDEIHSQGLTSVRFSQIHSESLDDSSVVVVDTIGHLRHLYALASIVFVGKSLTVGGGQNIIEPAFFGKPIVVGPHMENFQDIIEIFTSHEAVVQIKNEAQLTDCIEDLLKNRKKADVLGYNAFKVVQEYQGATKKTIGLIKEMLRAQYG